MLFQSRLRLGQQGGGGFAGDKGRFLVRAEQG